MRKLNLNQQQSGSLILFFLILIPFIIAVTIYYTELALTSYQAGVQDQGHTESQFAADAGADYGIEQLTINNTWTGTNGQVTLHSDSSYKTTYSDSVTNGSNNKTLLVTGRTYRPATAASPLTSVSIAVTLYPVTSSAESVISGAGGLFMSNSAKIVGGSVFINGGISMTNSSQIGLSVSPLTVQVADDNCPIPADATYPRVCNANEGGQPIILTNSSHIYGTVTATNQTSGSGMSSPGLVSGSVSPQALPVYNRSAQIAAVTSTVTGASESCSRGTETWPANLKITGNVTISNSCALTIMGDVWITGNLSASNSAQLIVTDSLGNTVPHLMVDGSGGVSLTNSADLVPNASGTGFEILTFWSTASCSPSCSSVTGTDLYNSRSVTTISLSNTVSATNTTLYAYWSQVNIANSGQIGSVIGQTIKLSNTAAITFGGSSGSSTTVYIVKGYRRQ